MSTRGILGASLLGFTLSFGCAGEEAGPAAPPPPSAVPVDYSFGTVDGELIGSNVLRGRVTVLLFITTFDLASQAQAKRLEDLHRQHAPRINAVGVVLEAARYVDLARAFRDITKIHYPLAMASESTLAGVGPFGGVNTVPTWVVPDRRSAVHSVFRGPLEPEELEKLVVAAE